jgi:hypothetical protein
MPLHGGFCYGFTDDQGLSDNLSDRRRLLSGKHLPFLKTKPRRPSKGRRGFCSRMPEDRRGSRWLT